MNTPLKIEHVRIREIDLPLRIPFQISGGTMRSRKSIIIELHSDGAVGYGESAPFEFPFYSSETIGSVLALYRDLLIERIEGKSFDSIESFESELRRGVRGNNFAICGFENAYWDLQAAVQKRTLQELIAEQMARMGIPPEWRSYQPRVASGVAVGIPESEYLDELKTWIESYLDEGYRRVKIKIRPGWDIDACRVARETVGASFMLWPDANASFNYEQHRAILQALDEFHMAFLEQPLHHDDLLDHAKLAAEIDTPICLDESLKSARVGRQAIAVDAAKVWNIKVQRMGGLLEAIRAYSLAVRFGVKLWGGTMPESGIGAQPILALASFPGFVFPADVEPSNRWYEPNTDPVEIAMSEEGDIDVPQAHGVSILIDTKRLAGAGKVIRD